MFEALRRARYAAFGRGLRTATALRPAPSASERLVAETIALMFHSILAEDRVPAAIRLWFARLQTPVIRIALLEPEFFSTGKHPARQLIDRLGACVLGFDAREISSSALEAEIKRLVQVIEQYPDIGQRVFQQAHDEFGEFLVLHHPEHPRCVPTLSLNGQVAEKDTLEIQYIIGLRKMLDRVPVGHEVSEFLFKVWAEVLALAAVRHGPGHDHVREFRQSASDLVWAASPRSGRSDGYQPGADTGGLLHGLRRGLVLIGLDAAQQEAKLRPIRAVLDAQGLVFNRRSGDKRLPEGHSPLH